MKYFHMVCAMLFKKSALLWIGMLACVAWTSFVPRCVAASPKPNILFILTDDLGINDLHCYQRKDHNTPNLDRMAEQGTRFTSAYCAQPICSPSRAAILTGKTPARLHLTTFLPGRADCPAQKLLHPAIKMEVPLEEKMIPEYLKPAGYVTACIGKWHVGGKGFGPEDQGFDFVQAGKPNTVPSETEGGKGEYGLTAAAEKFMEDNRDRPFFVYLAHNTPHIPYTAKAKLIEKNSGAFEPVYAAVIESMDDTVGRLLKKLDDLHLTDNTLVIFTSDNGGLHVPEGPHSRITHNTPFRTGKGYLYEGGLRIPLIARWPGKIPAGRIVDDPVVNTDWLPTFFELIGLPAVEGLDGQSFASLLLGKGKGSARSFYWHFPHYTNQGGQPGGAVRNGDWKLIEWYETGKVELFNLAQDYQETTDIASKHPEIRVRLQADLAAWRDRMNAQRNTLNPDFKPELHRALYVDTDPTKFNGATADAKGWEQIQLWRANMNQAVAGAKAAGGKKKGKAAKD